MRATSAFFAGVGTVAVAIGAGLGGGLLLGEIMSPQQPKYPSSEVRRLEQRGSPQPIQAANGASQPVPYLPTTQTAATVAEPQSQPQPQPQQPQSQPQQPQSQPQQPQQQAQPNAQEPQPQQTAAKPAEPKQAEPVANAKSQPAAAAPQPVASTEPPAASDRAAPEDANARARDGDLKRDTRGAYDRRKSERRQQWTERRKWRPRDGDDDLSDVEASVRQATEPRSRSFFGRDEPRQTSGREESRRTFGREESRRTFGREEERQTFDRDDSRPIFGGNQGFGRLRIFDSDD